MHFERANGDTVIDRRPTSEKRVTHCLSLATLPVREREQGGRWVRQTQGWWRVKLVKECTNTSYLVRVRSAPKLVGVDLEPIGAGQGGLFRAFHYS